MKLSGHKTEAVYRRYAITNESDLSEGVAKLEGASTARAIQGGGSGAPTFRHKIDTIGENGQEREGL